jgi:predicted transcriptional regulator
MKTTLICLFATIFLCVSINAQTTTNNQTQSSTTSETKPKRIVFRATKDQVMQAQKMLKVTESGKLSKEDHDAVKTYQTANGLKATGGLNRATLEKMGITLTDKQKEIPVSPNSFATADKENSGEKKKRGPVFKATKDQVMQAQKMLKVTESGKLDDTTREALKTYQEANGVKSTGTLNKVTLEKMGITLTDKQKEM